MTEHKTAVKKPNLSLWALVMLIFVPTFGFNNITANGGPLVLIALGFGLTAANRARTKMGPNSIKE